MKKNYKVSVTFTASKEFNIKADSPEAAVNRFLDTFINTDFITVNNADIAEILVNCGNSDSETKIISENFIRSGTTMSGWAITTSPMKNPRTAPASRRLTQPRNLYRTYWRNRDIYSKDLQA